jgi:hypothetical protein
MAEQWPSSTPHTVTDMAGDGDKSIIFVSDPVIVKKSFRAFFISSRKLSSIYLRNTGRFVKEGDKRVPLFPQFSVGIWSEETLCC